MTPIAALVAEALRVAEKATPEKTEGCHHDARAVRIWQGCVVLGTPLVTGSTMPNYTRRDVVTAALVHLAVSVTLAEAKVRAFSESLDLFIAEAEAAKARAAEAEGRAERAEARIVKLRATLDAAAQASGANAVIDLCDNALCVDILDADQPDADAAVPRG